MRFDTGLPDKQKTRKAHRVELVTPNWHCNCSNYLPWLRAIIRKPWVSNPEGPTSLLPRGCFPCWQASQHAANQAARRRRAQPQAPKFQLQEDVPSVAWLHEPSWGAARPSQRLPLGVGLVGGGTRQAERPPKVSAPRVAPCSTGLAEEDGDGAISAISSAMRPAASVPMHLLFLKVPPDGDPGQPGRTPLAAEDGAQWPELFGSMRATSPRENGTNIARVSSIGKAHVLPSTGLTSVPGEDEARGLLAAKGEASKDAAGCVPWFRAGAKGHSFWRQAVVATSLGVQKPLAGDNAGGAPKATGLGEQTSGELVGEGHTVNAAVKGVSSEPCKQALLGPGAHGHRRVRHCVVATFIGVTRVGTEHDEGDGLGEAYACPGWHASCRAAGFCAQLRLVRCKAPSGSISLR